MGETSLGLFGRIESVLDSPQDTCSSRWNSRLFQSDLKRTVVTRRERNANRYCGRGRRRTPAAFGFAGVVFCKTKSISMASFPSYPVLGSRAVFWKAPPRPARIRSSSRGRRSSRGEDSSCLLSSTRDSSQIHRTRSATVTRTVWAATTASADAPRDSARLVPSVPLARALRDAARERSRGELIFTHQVRTSGSQRNLNTTTSARRKEGPFGFWKAHRQDDSRPGAEERRIYIYPHVGCVRGAGDEAPDRARGSASAASSSAVGASAASRVVPSTESGSTGERIARGVGRKQRNLESAPTREEARLPQRRAEKRIES